MARHRVLLIMFSVLFLNACSNATTSNDINTASQDMQNITISEKELGEAEKEEARQSRLKMSDETLSEFYYLDPSLKEKVEQAYGYALFDDHIFNIVFYVAGYGSGVAYRVIETVPSDPIYMLKLRAGVGPGLGYAKHRQLLIIENEATFDLMMTVGIDVQASANATLKIKGFGGSVLFTDSFNPYLDIYTITDKGINIQANWGSVEYLKDWTLNPDDDVSGNESSSAQ